MEIEKKQPLVVPLYEMSFFWVAVVGCVVFFKLDICAFLSTEEIHTQEATVNIYETLQEEETSEQKEPLFTVFNSN